MAFDSVVVSRWIKSNTSKLSDGAWGWLVAKGVAKGKEDDKEGGKELELISFIKPSDILRTPPQAATAVPMGLPLVGFVCSLGTNASGAEAVAAFIKQHSMDIDVFRPSVNGEEVIVLCVEGDPCAVALKADNTTRELKVCEVGKDPSLSDMVLLRLAFCTHFSSIDSVYDQFDSIKDVVSDHLTALYLPASASRDKSLLFEMNSQDPRFDEPCSTLRDVAQRTKQSKKDKTVAAIETINQKAITFTLLRNRSLAQDKPKCPVVHFRAGDGASKRTNIRIDVLCYASPTTSIRASLTQLLQGAHSQIVYRMHQYATSPQGEDTISAFHFAPFCHPHPLTAVYPTKSTLNAEEQNATLIRLREISHESLSLPQWPLLRIGNALTFNPPNPALLRDIHLRVPPSGVQGGKQAFVQGHYDYHHYMQDKFDDAGWGCAYRTFQTIVSWIKLQQFAPPDTPIPDHRTIQETLVQMEERKAAFVGSRDWIGAIELGLLCDNMFDIPAKILNVPSGTVIPSKAREFIKHFETHGSPIMIGGGQLAYGLIGVDFNEKSGEVKFLILDPHYIGSEDVGTIVNKKWCGWHGPELFLRNAFYNFCMPQRPKKI